MKKDYNGMEIAVIGMSGKFPGANDIDKFWQNLKNSKESITFSSTEDLFNSGEKERYANHPNYVKANSYLEGKENFDASFFGYVPDEASLMDPQMRVFHECVWSAMEDAGYIMSEYEDKIGVFAGGATNVNWQNYAQIINSGKEVDELSAYVFRDVNYIATRISYLFNLRGPSIYINSACSTSLVAIQRASMSLLLRECDMAMAGGVSIGNKSEKGYLYQEGMTASKDGHCRAFDANASGTIRGEGAGVVVLKRLKDALADKDNIHAVIRGSAVNNDGRNKVGYTAPGISGQRQAHLKARKMANVPAESISYVEAHGTGTPLGDPIEIEALTLAYGKSEKKYCALGSVKTNIGHLDAAAGVAGFIKTVLSLKHRQLPASLNFDRPNPKINFDSSPFYVNTELKDWKVEGYPLRAGVSSFGIGGTNAHVILEEPPEVSSTDSPRPYHLLKLSGKTSGALQRNAEHLLEYFKRGEDVSLSDVAYTLNTGRESFSHRKVLVSKDREELIGQLGEMKESRGSSAVSEKAKYKVVFMFPGQGSQHVNMCGDLYEREPVFRESVDQCFEIIMKLSGRALKEVVFSRGSSAIDELENALPLLFSFEYSLARLLMSWGIKPDSLIGHSNAEYVAACISGLLSLESALGLIVRRGSLMQQMPSGKMLSVSISSSALQPYLDQAPEIAFAAHNSATSCVVSGPSDSVDAFQAMLEGAGIMTKAVRSSHAGHSPMMEGMLEAYGEALDSVTFSEMEIPFVTNYTGKEASYEEVSKASYWLNHLRHTVKFSEGIGELMSWEHVLFVEVGPGKTLGSFVGGHESKGSGHQVINLLGHPKAEENDFKRLFEGMGKLWLHGHEPDWGVFYEKEYRKKVSLPTYSFEQEKYPANVDAAKMIMEMMSVQRVVSTSLSECLYVPSWTSSELLKDEEGASTDDAAFITLFFVDDRSEGLTEGLLSALESRGEAVIGVYKGNSFEKTETTITIDPEEAVQYGKLFESIDRKGSNVRIIFGWGLSVDESSMNMESLQKKLGESYFSLLNLTRALSEWVGKDKVEITTLTHRLHQVLGKEAILPDQSPLLGAVKVIPKEYTNMSCRNIDISDVEGGEEMISSLIDELLYPDGEHLVSYRYGTRFTPSLRQKVVDLQETDKSPFVAGGVYLITGGLGGVGLTYAEQLSEEVEGVQLILLGRKSLPPKAEWLEWLTLNKDNKVEDPQYRIIEKLLKLEEMGSGVHYASVDLTDVEALRSTITPITNQRGPLRGVIHTAGVGDFAGVIHKRSREECEGLFSSKVYGTLGLTAALEGEELDFMVYCSSYSSVSAPFGQVGYVSANLFLESYARSQSLVQKGKVISIGWNQWSEVGIAAREIAANRFRLSEDSITPEEGYDLLKRSLKLNSPEVFITRYDPNANGTQGQPVLKVSSSSLESATVEEPFTEGELSSYSALESGLLELWKAFFGKTDLEVSDDFFEIGGDSLKALTMTRRINMHFHVDISLVDFFKHSTIVSLSSYLSDQESHGHESIVKAEEQAYYGLSSAQRRMYFLYEFDRNSLAYNLPQVVRFSGKLDREKLTGAFRKLVARHEVLRTSFEMEGDGVMQKVHETCDFDLAYYESEESEVSGLVREFIRPFDLSTAPLIRVGLIRVSAEDHVLMVDTHHIVSDGTSEGILIRDFMRLYQGEDLSALPLQYKDYSTWQGSEVYQSGLSTQRDYWQEVFSEPVEVMELPTDHPRPRLMEHSGGKVSFVLDEKDTAALKQVSREEGTTMFMVLLSLLNVLLSRLSNQEDIVIGTPTAGRNHTDLEEMIGMFVNTLVLRNRVEGTKTFKTFLQEVKERTLTAFDNQDYQYEELIDMLNVSREPNRNPLFDVMFVFQNFEAEEFSVPGIKSKGYDSTSHQISKFDLTFRAAESKDHIHFNVVYATELFSEKTITRFITYFKNIVGAIAKDSTARLSIIDILPEDEKTTLLNKFNQTAQVYDEEQTIVSLFEQQVAQVPDHIAITCEGVSMSYGLLHELSELLASKISAIASDSKIVGLYFDPSLEMIVSILATLKSGRAFLPLDPEHSQSRNEEILKNSGGQVLLTKKDMEGDLQFSNMKVAVELDCLKEEPESELTTKPGSNDPSYLIYTSGSSGKPKGVKISHKNLVNYSLWFRDFIQLSHKDKSILTSSYAFDLGYSSIFPTLVTGGELHLVSKELYSTPETFLNYLSTHAITYLKLTPSLFSTFSLLEESQFQVPPSLEYIVFGGESIKAENLEAELSRFGDGVKFVNHYGPTETTIGTVATHIERETISSFEKRPLIGRPVSNARCYVLGKNQELLPVGAAGELCVAGQGVSLGYHQDKNLTDQKFIANPHNKEQVIYKTGDMVRWLPDGNLEFLGRIDQQVKIRGFRVELSEIENQLTTRRDIAAAHVVAKNRDNHAYLVGYYISEKKVDAIELRNYLAESLPDYMLPSYFVQLQEFPLTLNGKINHKALPQENIALQTNHFSPQTEKEKLLCEVWSQVLRIENIGIRDNFFAIGGDSIKSIQISSRMRLAGYEMSIKDIFNSQTIEQLAPKLKVREINADQSEVSGEVPLTAIQEWFFAQQFTSPHHYNQSVMLNFTEGISSERVHEIFDALQTHHDALRMRFWNEGNRIIQENQKAGIELAITEADLKKDQDPQKALLSLCNEVQSSIDLERGPLMKLGLFHLNDGSRLLIAIHHLVMDGVSWRILFEDIETLYSQLTKGSTLNLPPKTEAFKKWASSIQSYVQEDQFLKNQSYWRSEIDQDFQEIQRDFPDGSNQYSDASTIAFQLDENSTQLLLTKVNRPFNTQINDILLSALLLSINQCFNTHTLRIDFEGHGREEIFKDVDISRTIGWFTSIHPVQLNMESDDLRDLIKSVKEKLRSVPNNGVDHLISKFISVDSLQGEDRAADSRIRFNYLGQFDSDTENKVFAMASEPKGLNFSLGENRIYDWDFTGMVAGGNFSLNLTYSKLQFKRETVVTLMKTFKERLESIIAYCSQLSVEELTPSDLTYKNLTIRQVELLQSRYVIKDVYPLSPMQEGMMFHALLDSHADFYFEQISYRLKGEVDAAAVRKSFSYLINRYDILRTLFIDEGYERPLQVVLKEREPDFTFLDITEELANGDFQEIVQSYRNQDKAKKFELSHDPLMRVIVLKVGENEYEFIWSHHHILMDGWCMGVLINEFSILYKCFKQHTPIDLTPVQPYSSYISWLEERDKEESSAYWKEYLRGYEKTATLPKNFGFLRSSGPYQSKHVSARLNRSQTTSLRKLGSQYSVTLNTIIQSFWAIMLARYNNTKDVVFGTVVSGRPPEIPGIETMVGLFINTIPTRITFNGNESLGTLFQQVQQSSLEMENYHYNSLPEIQSISDLGKNLIDSIMIFENYPVSEKIEEGELEVKNDYLVHNMEVFEQAHYDLSVMVFPGEEIRIEFLYNGHKYDDETVKMAMNHLIEMVEKATTNSEISICDIDLLSAGERTLLIQEFNDVEENYDDQQTLTTVFEKWYRQTPDEIALIYNEEELSYQELGDRVNEQYFRLQQAHVSSGDVVAIMVDRSPQLIISMLAVLKAGAAYLPIDTGLPDSRVKFMLKDSKASLLITEGDWLESFEEEIAVLDVWLTNGVRVKDIPSETYPSTQLAYIIYTSGSTGVPKGVMVEHRSVVNLLTSVEKRYGIARGERVLMFSNASFDASVVQMWSALFTGSTVIVTDSSTIGDNKLLNEYLIHHRVTHFETIPSFLSNFEMAYNPHLKRVVVGGEKCPIHLARKYSATVDFFNVYGPTETTIVSHVFHFNHRTTDLPYVPLGKQIANTRVYILDERNELQPQGVIGEICIGGHGVSRGYLNNAELTREKFIESPFHNGEIIYKTGDLGRWLPDGNIDFIGRVDDQVKIRGYRIETGEIESCLASHDSVNAAAILVTGEEDEKELVAYYLSNEDVSNTTLREHLSVYLPHYMLPSSYVGLQEFPITTNGKLDREALSKIDLKVEAGSLKPTTPTQKLLLGIWSDVLKKKKEQISINKSFFELGGHSLKAMTLVNKMSQDLNISLPVRAVFAHEDIISLAAHIDTLDRNTHASITRAPIKPFYAASSAQQRLFFLHEFDRNSVAYNMPRIVRLNGELKLERLESAFEALIRRHDIFRTTLEMNDGKVVQRVADHLNFEITHFETNELNIEDIVGQFIRPFDLQVGPLFRVGLIHLSSEDQILMMDMHHIISDGASQGHLINELMRVYNEEQLHDLPLQYRDYAEWQQDRSQQERLAKQRSFWLREFEGDINVLDIPTDYPRPKEKDHSGATLGFLLTAEESAGLKTLSEQHGTTMFMTLLSVFNVLLSKLSNEHDIVIGTPVAGRNHADLEGMQGMFVNTLALRNYPTAELSFEAFLQEVKQRVLSCFENQDYQYEELVDALDLNRDTGRNPLFDVVFAYQNFEEDAQSIPGLTVYQMNSGHETAKFDLTFTVSEIADGLHVSVNYATELFNSSTIDRFISYLKAVIKSVTIDATVKLLEIDVLSDRERHQQISEFNDTESSYNRETTLVGIFENWVEETPNETALVFHEEELSYLELNQRSNELCSRLQALGVKPGDIVAIMIERSPELVIGIMAILKAGAAYLPIDTKLPASRVRFMLEDSGARLLLTEETKIESYDKEISVFDIRSQENAAVAYQPVAFPSSNLAYIIYTSGSTGTPKGVMIEHRSLINLLLYHQKTMDITRGERMLMFSSASFDASVGQIWYAFNSGSAVVVVDEETLTNSNQLNQYLIKSKVSYFEVMPSFLSNFEMDYNPHLKRIVVGGEKCPLHLAEKYGRSLNFFNAYGPTEATIVTNIFHYNKRASDHPFVSIGRQIANTSAYILSKNTKLQPVGVVGELYLGGHCLSRGYLNNHELTSEKFIRSPFRSEERLYKTGDLARWLPDGNIEFIGRVDDQIKVRGYRIETGEIESCLLTIESITAAAVILSGTGNDAVLIAYYVSSEEMSNSTLKDHLSGFLPEYMLPSYYVHLENLPVTTNAKLDRKALPKVVMMAGEEYAPPTTKTEEKLVELWSEVLNLRKDQISVNRSFFDLGGHSLKAMTLTNWMSESMDVRVPVKEIFIHQDIKSLSSFIEGLSKNEYLSIPRVQDKPYYAASSAQQRQYFLHELDKGSMAYNLPQIVRIKGNLDVDQLEESFRRLISRHEIFRTKIEMHKGQVVQRVVDDLNFNLLHFNSDESGIQAIVDEFIKPFDLNKGPLIRVGLIHLSTLEHILMLDVHHVISDGVSQGNLVNELMSMYKGQPVKKLSLQYRDYSEWQQSKTEQVRLSAQKSFWLNEFEEEIKILNIPADFHRPKVKNHAGATYGFLLTAEESAALKALSLEHGATMFMTMLSVLNVLLSKLSNEHDIIVGTPTSGRSHPDLEEMQGMFVNTLALRTYPKKALSFNAFLQEVKEKVLDCFEYQDYQYEDLIDELEVTRDTSRNPLFDVMFSYHNYEEKNEATPGLQFSPVRSGHEIAKFDMSFTANELGNEIHISVNYSTELFTSSTIERYMDYLKRVISSVNTNSAVSLAEIDILSEEERYEQLIEFNDSASPYDKDLTLVDVFENWVEKTPDETALVYENEEFSYFDLNEAANEISARLQGLGIGPDDIVAIMVERSPELIFGIIGILKTGATYLPVDTSLPESRVKLMIKESGAELLLTEGSNLVIYKKAVRVHDVHSKQQVEESYRSVTIPSTQLAYIIYTSGSTGQPKGVMVEHRSVINLINSLPGKYGIVDKERVLLFSNVSFDASVEQMWLAFDTGGALVVPNKNMILSESMLNAYLLQSEVTHLDVTPSFLANFTLEEIPSLRRINVGGEKCPVTIAQKYADNYPIFNAYGPTEATITTHVYSFDSESVDCSALPLGSPVANTRTYILSEDNMLQPMGVVGEICIGGHGLSRGYLNNEELTIESFVESPFDQGERIYKTGDLGRWLPDRNIEIVGRVDDQVKIRGYRVELGEIESHLLSHELITAAAVLLVGEGENKQLVAYYVSSTEDLHASLKVYQAENLPSYMVPSHYVQLNQLPITTNGKLDLKALPELKSLKLPEYVAPLTPMQYKITAIWSEVLDLEKDQIGIDQSFFQLGGHSLKAMVLFRKLSELLDAPIALVDLFTYPTVMEFANHVDLKTERNNQLNTSEIIRLKYDHSNEKNLFLIHDGSGDVHGYLELISYIEGCNCWGIRSKSLSDLTFEASDVREIASNYVRLIRTIQQQGPFLLAGWSTGGILAHEMASQLESVEGEKVSHVFMFDTAFNVKSEKLEGDLLTEIRDSIAIFLGWDQDEWTISESYEALFSGFRKRVKDHNLDVAKLLKTIPADLRNMLPNEESIDVESILMYFKTITMLERAVRCYVPEGKVEATLVYIQASGTHFDWKQLTQFYKNPIKAHSLEATHFSILKEPVLKALEPIVNDVIIEIEFEIES